MSQDYMQKTESPIIGEVINSEGKPTGVRRTDALAMLDLSARVESSDELMKLSGASQSWAVAINAFLDLFDAPHNVSELWVWNRFRAAFGGDTWKANDQLSLLVDSVKRLRTVTILWRNRSKLSWLKRRALKKDIGKAQASMLNNLAEIVENLDSWPDRDGFELFSRRQ